MWYIYNNTTRNQQISIQCKTSNNVIPSLGLSFKSNDLKKHMENVCSRDLAHKCFPCNLSFYTIEELKTHKKTHSTLTTCTICDKTFDNFLQLNAHTILHRRDVEPPECKYCHKVFATKLRMISHLVIHTKVKAFECIWCNERFVVWSELLEHRKNKKQKKLCELSR